MRVILDKKLAQLTEKLRATTRMTPKALIATIYADMLVPHGGTVWLGSIVKLAKLFDVVEYLSRTSALRLVYDGWLHPTRIGKLSFYSMTEEHITRLKEHYPRVYGPPVRIWSGTWYLLLTAAAGLNRKQLLEVRQNFKFHGVGQLATNIYISAAETLDAIDVILLELDLRDKVEVMRAESVLPKDTGLLRKLVQSAWDIENIASLYDDFLSRFRPIRLALEKVGEIDPQTAFILRAILINEYRIIALQDPRLPQELLPEPWSGTQAFNLCKSLYQSVLEPSEEFLRISVKTADGPIGDAGDLLYSRFNGLSRERQI